MFEWDDARYFLAVHRGGSLSAAARALRVNQSTVGRRIAALEDALGVRVFAKTPEGYVMTPDGERLLPHVERMEEETFAVGRALAGEPSQVSGLVRITSSDGFGARVLSRVLAELRLAHPEIDVDLIADNRTLSLGRREADLAVRFSRSREAMVVSRRLIDFGSSLYASESYLSRRGRPRDRNYSGHDFIGFTNVPSNQPEAGWLIKFAEAGRIVFTSNSTFALFEATLSGLGIGILPCYLGDTEPSLVCVASPEDVLIETLWLAIHRDLQHSARVRACAEFIVQALEKLEPLVSGRAVRQAPPEKKRARRE
jgi:DNA-binding transcriptional LysR family regulator